MKPHNLVQRLTRKLAEMVHPTGSGRAWYSVLAGTDSDYDYEREAGDPWRCSAVAACLRVLADNFAQPPLEVHRTAGRGKGRAIEGHPAAVLCDRPNDAYDRYALWASFVLSAVCDGNAYLVKVRSAAGIPVELWWVPPGTIEPKGPESGRPFISHYEYRAAGRLFAIDPQDVIHYRHGSLDPQNPRKGLAPLKAGLRAICGINEADGYTASLLRNMGVPAYALVPRAADGKGLTREQAQQAKESWRRNATGSHRGEVFVSTGPIEAVRLGYSPEELALDKLPARLEDQVAALTGVDPMVAGLTSGAQHKTYANKAEARRGFYEETLIPFQARVACCLDLHLLGDVGMGDRARERFAWNYAGIACLADHQGELYTRVGVAYKEHQLLKRSEAREQLGLDVDPIADDVYFADLHLPALGAARYPDVDANPTAMEGEKRHPFGGPTGSETSKAETKAEPWPDAGHDEANTYRLPLGTPIARKLKAWFRKQKQDVLKDWLPPNLALVPESFPSLADYDDPMASAMTPVLAGYWSESGQRVYSQLGLDPADWRVVDPRVRDKIATAALDFCAATNATTSDQLNSALARLREELTEGIVDQGDSLAELRKRVRSVFDQAEEWRAERIAATEASRAVHAAQIESAIASGVVSGKRILLSADACELCQRVAASVPPEGVPLDAEFATTSDHPVYGSIKFPPIHPSCQCTIELVLIDLGADVETAAPSPPPPPAAPPEYPPDLTRLQVIRQLGGSTGAELVEDEWGRQWVRKRGANPGHLREEATADAIYRAMGIDVPRSRIYETASGPVKLAEYIEGQTLGSIADPARLAAAKAELAKGFAADALLGNWDVVGLSGDNVLVAPDGKVYRIDNGGSLRYRAQGARKSASQWTDVVGELTSLRDPSVNKSAAQVFGTLTDAQIKAQIKDLLKQRPAILAAAPAELQDDLKKRLDYLDTWAKPKKAKKSQRWKPSPESDFRDLSREDGHQWGRNNYDAWAQSLTADERRAVDYYTGVNFVGLNRYLRTGQAGSRQEEAVYKKMTSSLDAALAKGKLKEGVVVYRAADLSSVVDVAKLKPGDAIPDLGFTSTSVRPQTPFSGTRLEIRVPKGASAGYMDAVDRTGRPISVNPNERELLLGRDVSEFRMVGWRERTSKYGSVTRWLILEAVVKPIPSLTPSP